MLELTPAMEALLSRLPDWPGAGAAQVEALPGGTGNRILRVRFGAEDVVLRQSLPQASACKLDAASEGQVLTAASAAGIAPPLRARNDNAGLTISDFLPGVRPWTEADLRSSSNLQRLAELLGALHGLELVLAPFDVLATARRYLTAAPGFAVELGEELELLAGEFQASTGTPVLCHNDLVAANVLDNSRLWLVDFEYAVGADPILDLAGAAALNGLDRAGRRRLLATYYGDSAPSPERFERVCRLVLLLALVWAEALEAEEPHGPRQVLKGRLQSLLSLMP